MSDVRAASPRDMLGRLENVLHMLHVAHQRIVLDPGGAAVSLRDAIEVIERTVPDLRTQLLAEPSGRRAGHPGEIPMSTAPRA